MALSWTIFLLGCLSLGLAPHECSATESPTTTAPKTAHEAPAVDLGALLDAGQGAVVTLVAGGTRLAAHRAVLAARSPTFKAMLSGNSLEASIQEVDVSNVEGPVLRELLVFLYTLQAPRMSSMAPQLLAAADSYGVSGLKSACEQQLVARLSAENAASSAVLALRHSCPRLREAAVAFIRANLLAVMSTEAWHRALASHPNDVIHVMRLLAQPPTATSTPAAADSGSAPGQTHSGSSQTPAASTPAPPACNASPPDDDKVSEYRRLSAAEKGGRLIQAAGKGAVGELRALLAAGADVAAADERMLTALHHAAAQGHVEAARWLLACGADVDDARNRWRETPLHEAAFWGNVAVVRLLLDASADANAKEEDGWTPLHMAAQQGHAAVVRLLAAAGADVNAKGDMEWAPLHFAADLGHAEAAAALLEAGADRGATNCAGETPLAVAKRENHKALVDLLTRS